MITTLLIGIVAIPVVIAGWLMLAEAATGRISYGRLRSRLRAGAWMVPAGIAVCVVLLYPAIYSLIKSFYGKDGNNFVGLDNFKWMFSSSSILNVLKNNLLWVVIFTVVTTGAGLLVAIVSDKVPYERVAKAIVVAPTAISLTVTGVIWNLVYQYQPVGAKQTGTVSAATQAVGLGSHAWVQNSRFSTYAIILAAVWVHAGIATVILSAAVKSIPSELIEAARMDGAGSARILWHITLTALRPTIVVVGTVEVIYALKVFDIVYIMTGGLYGSDVIANHVYSELFLAGDLGRASALSVFLLVLVIPVIVFNIKQMEQ